MQSEFDKNINNLARQFIRQNGDQLGAMFKFNKEIRTEIKEILKKQGPIAATLNAYHNIDNLIIEGFAKDPCSISCHGCQAAHCCHQPVEICEAEAATIGQFCKENNIIIPRQYLKQQLALNKTEIAQSDCSACVFLKDHRCSIYRVRPSACRTYHVSSPQVFCNTKLNRTREIAMISNPAVEVIKLALAEEGGKTGRMPKLLIKYSK